MSGAPLESEGLERGPLGREALAAAEIAAPAPAAHAWTSRSIHRRRADAARARRRRLLAIDAAIAVIIALLAIVLAPGVAIVALVALLVLAACGAWVLGERLRRRRATRRGAR